MLSRLARAAGLTILFTVEVLFLARLVFASGLVLGLTYSAADKAFGLESALLERLLGVRNHYVGLIWKGIFFFLTWSTIAFARALLKSLTTGIVAGSFQSYKCWLRARGLFFELGWITGFGNAFMGTDSMSVFFFGYSAGSYFSVCFILNRIEVRGQKLE